MARKTNGAGKAEPLLTVADVAALDQCSEKTVRRAIASGRLEAVRICPGGRLLRIDPATHRAYRRAVWL